MKKHCGGLGILMVVLLIINGLSMVAFAQEDAVARVVTLGADGQTVVSDTLCQTVEEALASGYAEITFLRDVTLPDGVMITGNLNTLNGAVVTFDADALIIGNVWGDIATTHNLYIYGQCYGHVTGGKRFCAVYCVGGENGSISFGCDNGIVDVGIGVPFVEYGSRITFEGQPNDGYQLANIRCDKFATPIQGGYTVFGSAAYWGEFSKVGE